MNTTALFEYIKNHDASDLHLKPGAPPTFRVQGELQSLEQVPPLTSSGLESFFQSMTSQSQREDFQRTGELDFSYQTGAELRFRVNASLQRGEISLALRRISLDIPSLEELQLPDVCQDLALRQQGLILVTGPTGSGKSTTLAAMIEHLNRRESRRIVTVEDPIEFLYQDKESFITQRELGSDTQSFAVAAKQALRQDPDVILVGEMRDPETMSACITAAETGHLVLSTLHTNNAPQSVDRLVDSFPPHQQSQIRMQLSLTLLAILAQRLLPRLDGSGRVPAVEIMIANNAVRNLIREGKTHQLLNVMQTGVEQDMQTMDRALGQLYQQGLISLDAALTNANDPKTLRSSLGGG